MKKIIIKVSIIAILFIVLLRLSFFIKDKPEQFFDLSDSSATYIITADENYYQLQPTDKNNKSMVIIASSPKNLNDFLNKEVHITGKFIFADPKDVLCPQINCQRLKRIDFNLKKMSAIKMEAIEITDIN
ncbi:MAG: hypothetical protein WCT51_01270 [Candidatus Shapirobacteria bacterium]|jgi:hypothetical protein